MIKWNVVDLFCGAGGVSHGIENAKDKEGNRVAKVVACVNHDEYAIKSHEANHPDAVHFTEDIRTVAIAPIAELLELSLKQSAGSKSLLWASLECTNFSNAKGGQPRDADSRTLANDLFRYIVGLTPDCIMIENVREFLKWGPLCGNGKPTKNKEGKDFQKWFRHVERMGYVGEWRLINSADLGAYTSRKRLFVVFVKEGKKVYWPKPTHSKKTTNALFEGLIEWNAVSDVLDLTDAGKCIFQRKKPLVENTLRRIFHGMVKEIDRKKPFLSAYYGNGTCTSVDSPAPTVTTKDRFGLITPRWLDKQYSGSQNHQSILRPCGALTCVNHYSLVTATPFVLNTSFDNGHESIEKPLSTVTANRKWHYLINPQWGGQSRAIDRPCHTLIARMDKAPPYIVSFGERKRLLFLVIFSSDSFWTKKIKELMNKHGIVSVKMRMLKIIELKKITGLPENYVLLGGKTRAKKYIGNAVPPIMAQKIIEANS